jgi:hypothetical protein
LVGKFYGFNNNKKQLDGFPEIYIIPDKKDIEGMSKKLFKEKRKLTRSKGMPTN